jgi:serine/threonine protein phosphatase PrpC
MIQLTNACVSSVDETRSNTSNLLFSGQILPERNAGLNGAPSLKLAAGAPCVAAVFDGAGDAANKAAYLAASAFRGAADTLRTTEDLESLFVRIHNDLRAATADRAGDALATAAAAACVDDGRLALASIGGCRAYLLRDRSLYLLSRAGADASPQAAPPAPDDGPLLGTDAANRPFTLRGALLPGDQVLLCTGWLPAALDAREMLRVMAESETPSNALQQLSRRAGSGRGDVAAVLLKVEEAPEEAAE